MSWRRLPTLASVIAIAALALLAAGCGGASKSPSVANIGTPTTPTTTRPAKSGTGPTSLPKGNASELLSEWATCMRKHGDPNQADPTIDSQKVIEITLPAGYNQGIQIGGKNGSNPCADYMAAASSALRGGAPIQKPDQAQMVQFSACMRANGIPDFPDPSGAGLSIRRGGDLDPSNPTFQNAQKLCGKKTGIKGPLAGGGPQPGMIKVQSAGAPPPGGSGG
jgi:hypothetical protein